mgnify:CR=1 FL=1
MVKPNMCRASFKGQPIKSYFTFLKTVQCHLIGGILLQLSCGTSCFNS